MLLSLAQIRAFLAALGIVIQAVEFDAAGKQIIARGNLRGQAFEKRIAFAEIESAFTDTDSTSASTSRINFNQQADTKQP